MGTIKRLMGIAAIALMITAILIGEARAEKKIGILLSNDQPRYEENKKGFMDQLKKDGFGEREVKYIFESAGGSKVKALEAAKKLAGARMDMVVTVGTMATSAAASQVKDIPLVFIMVWDPVGSKIAMDWHSSGNNTTGSSSKTPASKLLSTLKEIASVKRVAVLYTPGERNSEIQLKEFDAVKNDFAVKIVPVPLQSKERAASLLSEVAGTVEAVCLTGSTVIGDSIDALVDAATKAKIITASQHEDHVERGVMLGVVVDAYSVGRLAGEKAVKVLKGSKPASIPIEPLKKLDVVVNMKTARAMQLQLPPAFMKTVTKTIQ